MLCYVHVQYQIPQQLNLTAIGNLTLYAVIIVMDSSWEIPLYTSRGHRLLFPNKIIFLSLKIFYVLANGVDPDEMPHFVQFHQSFHT